MSDPETRALGRAAALLLLASLARWGWDAGGPEPPPPGEDASAGLLEESRALARSEAARSRPMAAGERLDPNTASEEDLDRLPGIGAVTARAIVDHRKAHGAFRNAPDLANVRGVGPAAVRRIAPYLDFSEQGSAPSRSPVPPGASAHASGARGGRGRAPAAARRGTGRLPVDVNRASASTLETLPGIGPALAGRIVEARSQRPFSSVEDLGRVSGIGPAMVARLRLLVVVGR